MHAYVCASYIGGDVCGGRGKCTATIVKIPIAVVVKFLKSMQEHYLCF